MIFAPTNIDETVTPQAIDKAISRGEMGLALNMALHLGENNILLKVVDAVAFPSIELIVKSADVLMLKRFIRFLAEQLVSNA